MAAVVLSKKTSVLVALLVSIGCNDSATMSGRVLYDNHPIPEGHIRLTPSDGPPIATEITNGEYAFDADDELTAGEYNVYVIGIRKTGKSMLSPEPKITDGQSFGSTLRDRIDEVEQYIPVKHNRSSKLAVVVEAGDNRQDFNLEK